MSSTKEVPGELVEALKYMQSALEDHGIPYVRSDHRDGWSGFVRAAIKADRELRAAEPMKGELHEEETKQQTPSILGTMVGPGDRYDIEGGESRQTIPRTTSAEVLEGWPKPNGGLRPNAGQVTSPAVADKVLPSEGADHPIWDSGWEFPSLAVSSAVLALIAGGGKTGKDVQEYAVRCAETAWDAARPTAPELSIASIQEQWNSGDQFTVREALEGAWRSGYYDAEYTHDSAYAVMKSKAFADDALKDLLTGDLREVMADVDAHALGCVRKAAGEPLNTDRSRDIVQRSIEEYAGAALIRSGEQASDPKYKPCYVCERPMDGLSEDDCHCFHRKELLGADRSSEQAPAARFDHVECQECGAYYVCERCGNSEPEIVYTTAATPAPDAATGSPE